MSKRLTNADLREASDYESIDFADHCAQLDRKLAEYESSIVAAERHDDLMIAFTYRRLAKRLEADIARYMNRRGLPTRTEERSA